MKYYPGPHPSEPAAVAGLKQRLENRTLIPDELEHHKAIERRAVEAYEGLLLAQAKTLERRGGLEALHGGMAIRAAVTQAGKAWVEG